MWLKVFLQLNSRDLSKVALHSYVTVAGDLIILSVVVEYVEMHQGLGRIQIELPKYKLWHFKSTNVSFFFNLFHKVNLRGKFKNRERQETFMQLVLLAVFVLRQCGLVLLSGKEMKRTFQGI